MIILAMSACGFNKESLYFGTDEHNDKSDTDVFLDILENWKNTVNLSEKEESAWMTEIETWIRGRVTGIMDASRRRVFHEELRRYGMMK